VDEHVARLEAKTDHIQSDVKDIKADMREMKADMRIEAKLDTKVDALGKKSGHATCYSDVIVP